MISRKNRVGLKNNNCAAKEMNESIGTFASLIKGHLPRVLSKQAKVGRKLRNLPPWVLCDFPTVDIYRNKQIYAILDEGCNRIVHGDAWARHAEARLESLGFASKFKASPPKGFKGLSGNARALGIRSLPFSLLRGEDIARNIGFPRDIWYSTFVIVLARASEVVHDQDQA